MRPSPFKPPPLRTLLATLVLVLAATTVVAKKLEEYWGKPKALLHTPLGDSSVSNHPDAVPGDTMMWYRQPAELWPQNPVCAWAVRSCLLSCEGGFDGCPARDMSHRRHDT